MLKLLKLEPKRKVNYILIYSKLFDKILSKYAEDTENRKYLKQLVFYGIKTTNELMKEKEDFDYESLLKIFQFIEIVKMSISLLTPNELITVFPIDKKYDGDKYEMKDYFYTIKELEKIGMNSFIAEHVDYLLWDYMNRDVERFVVKGMSVLSDIYKMETGYGILEKWAEDNNIQAYKLCKNETTKQEFLFNHKTGKSFSLKKESPLRLVK